MLAYKKAVFVLRIFQTQGLDLRFIRFLHWHRCNRLFIKNQRQVSELWSEKENKTKRHHLSISKIHRIKVCPDDFVYIQYTWICLSFDFYRMILTAFFLCFSFWPTLFINFIIIVISFLANEYCMNDMPTIEEYGIKPLMHKIPNKTKNCIRTIDHDRRWIIEWCSHMKSKQNADCWILLTKVIIRSMNLYLFSFVLSLSLSFRSM